MNPYSERKHIGIFGRTNVGKSTLLNDIVGEEVSIVSEEKGTTTDAVKKPFELDGVGAVLFYDTAGFDDETSLEAVREERSLKLLKRVDLALLLVSDKRDVDYLKTFLKGDEKVLFVITKNEKEEAEKLKEYIEKATNKEVMSYDRTKEALKELRALMKAFLKDEERLITGDLVQANDMVVLVMPQDDSAPKGRLILPQVQTLRELLDREIVAMSTTVNNLRKALDSLKEAPNLIITDSRVLKEVVEIVPKEVPLTTFSVLFSCYKGDKEVFIKGAESIDELTNQSRVLIAEACSHAPKEEDIGTVKIPALLRKRWPEIAIDFSRGDDFPEDISKYDLVIQCGSCMFTRTHVLSRVKEVEERGVKMTNYGMAIAKLTHGFERLTL
ncbi:[FeFe] hydrogenase H-cluster maturation GTPase HydF [Guggenheimella bovis]